MRIQRVTILISCTIWAAHEQGRDLGADFGGGIRLSSVQIRLSDLFHLEGNAQFPRRAISR